MQLLRRLSHCLSVAMAQGLRQDVGGSADCPISLANRALALRQTLKERLRPRQIRNAHVTFCTCDFSISLSMDFLSHACRAKQDVRYRGRGRSKNVRGGPKSLSNPMTSPFSLKDLCQQNCAKLLSLRFRESHALQWRGFSRNLAE